MCDDRTMQCQQMIIALPSTLIKFHLGSMVPELKQLALSMTKIIMEMDIALN